MALGEGSTWITVSEAGKAKFSDHLSNSYLKLTQKYNESDLNFAQQIILGSDGYYFIQHTRKDRWYLPSGVSSEIDMKRNSRKVDVCAIGMAGTYVFQLSTGALFWNLKGRYAGLQKDIEGEGKRPKLIVSLTYRYNQIC
jgi:hypothetical protein